MVLISLSFLSVVLNFEKLASTNCLTSVSQSVILVSSSVLLTVNSSPFKLVNSTVKLLIGSTWTNETLSILSFKTELEKISLDNDSSLMLFNAFQIP